jgi:hypothetical protein
MCSQYVPNRTSLYPISFAKHCPLANIGTCVFFASIAGNFEKQKHVKNIFFPLKEM